MSLTEQRWWQDFVRRLQGESLSALAREFGVSKKSALAELLLIPMADNIREMPWWPEARRQLETEADLGLVAHRFDCDQRSLLDGLDQESELRGLPPMIDDVPDGPKVHLRRFSRRDLPVKSVLEGGSLGRQLPTNQSESKPSPARLGRRRIVRRDREDFEEPATSKKSVSRRSRSERSLHGKVKHIPVNDVDLAVFLPDEALSSETLKPVVSNAAVLPSDAPSHGQELSKGNDKTSGERTSTNNKSDAVLKSSHSLAQPPLGWRLRLDGEEVPVLVVADNIAHAAMIFAEHVGAEAMTRAELVLLGPMMDA